MKLYVGNLAYNISDDQLRDLFSRFGPPDSARVIVERESGRSKGFGFVEFSDAEIGKQALSLNGEDFGGRPLKVNEARPKTDEGGGRRPRY
jgi:cold-inducible RNA-binding protein